MIKDFRDANLDIIVMHRGTDDWHSFVPELESGLAFVWEQYDAVCEGRLAIASEDKNFIFPTSFEYGDDFPLVYIDFPASIITTNIRENKVYWKVLATHKDTGKTIVLRYGEVWLK